MTKPRKSKRVFEIVYDIDTTAYTLKSTMKLKPLTLKKANSIRKAIDKIRQKVTAS